MSEQKSTPTIDDLFGVAEPSKFLDVFRSNLSTEFEPDIEPSASDSKRKRKQPKVDEEERNQRTLFLGNLPATVRPDHLKSLIGKDLVETIRLRNITLADTKLKKQVAVRRKLIKEEGTCSAYVVMKKPSQVDDAIAKFNGFEYMEHVLRADHATMKGEKGKIDKDVNKRTVFIGHIPFDTTEDEIRDIFKECGEIHHVRMLHDERGRSRGVCYVTFENEDDVNFALQFNGSDFKKEKLTVERSNPYKAERIKKKKELEEEKTKSRKLSKKDKPTGKFGNRKKQYQAKPKPRSKSAGKEEGGKKSDTSFEGRHAKTSKLDKQNLAIKKYIKMRSHVNKKKREAANTH